MKKILLSFAALLLLTGAGFKYGGIKHDIKKITKSGITWTLTNASEQVVSFEGNDVAEVKLPSGTTLSNGYWYKIINNGATGSVVVTDALSSVLSTVEASESVTFYMNNSAAVGGNWSVADGKSFATQSIAQLEIDWSRADIFMKVLDQNSTFVFSNLRPKTIVVRLKNNGSYTVAWPAGVRWSGGTTPTQTVGQKNDIYTFIHDGSGSVVYGSAVQNFD